MADDGQPPKPYNCYHDGCDKSYTRFYHVVRHCSQAHRCSGIKTVCPNEIHYRTVKGDIINLGAKRSSRSEGRSSGKESSGHKTNKGHATHDVDANGHGAEGASSPTGNSNDDTMIYTEKPPISKLLIVRCPHQACTRCFTSKDMLNQHLLEIQHNCQSPFQCKGCEKQKEITDIFEQQQKQSSSSSNNIGALKISFKRKSTDSNSDHESDEETEDEDEEDIDEKVKKFQRNQRHQDKLLRIQINLKEEEQEQKQEKEKEKEQEIQQTDFNIDSKDNSYNSDKNNNSKIPLKPPIVPPSMLYAEL